MKPTKKSKQTEGAALLFSQLMTHSFVNVKLKLYIFLTHPICNHGIGFKAKFGFPIFTAVNFLLIRFFLCVFLFSSVNRRI